MAPLYLPFAHRTSLVAASLIAVASAPVTWALELVPVPKAAVEIGGTAPLAAGTYALTGTPGEKGRYALGVLAAALEPHAVETEPGEAAVLLRGVDACDDLVRAAEALNLAPPPVDCWQEAFVLDCGVTRPGRVVITGGPSGLVYGAYALSHLLNASDGLGLPRVAISDWPSLLTRAYTGIPRDVSAASLETLDWLARWRLNAGYYEIYGDQGQDSVPPEVADLRRECARRGITLYGLISNWRTALLTGRELCPCQPEDLARIRRYATEFLDRGCDGLIFLFDDITQAAVEHTHNCPECQGRFNHLAEAQLELMRPMLKVARERGITRLIVCPTPYYRGWQSSYNGKLDGLAYYATWRDAPQMEGVQVYHCLLRSEEIQQVQQAGLRNYIYWYNGAYEYGAYAPGGRLPEGLWGGFTQLAWGWYCCDWDPVTGVRPNADTYDAFRELPQLTRHAWLCNGGWYPWALWGCYCWDAERFDPDLTEHELVAALFGTTAQRHYARWRDVTRRWLPRLVAPLGVTEAAGREAIVRDFTAGATEAAQAALAFKEAVLLASAGIAGQALRTETADRMLRSAEAMTAAAGSAADGRCTVRVGNLTEVKLEQGVRRERQIELSSFWNRYVLRYSQTQEPGGALHRSQWHFGSGLGMLAPSYRNWYDAGFMDVLVDGQSLETVTPHFAVVPGEHGEDLLGTWDTPAGRLAVRFSLFEDGLRIAGRLDAAREVPITVQLFTIPAAGHWEDMNKYIVTEDGEFPHGTPVHLDPGQDWLFFADRTYDVPREHAEGPCAVLFGRPLPMIHSDNGFYVVQVDASYPPGTRDFAFVVWDFHGYKNAEALAAFRSRLDELRRKLDQTDM